MEKYRYMPTWSLPDYVFIPGSNPHPKKDGGHMDGEKDPEALPIDHHHPEKNECLRFALDLYNFGYYWESHVYFEALWNAHKRVGPEADFLKGMIKLGAAKVKISIDQQVAAASHFDRACELFETVQKSEGDSFLGFDLLRIIKDIENPEIHPHWK